MGESTNPRATSDRHGWSFAALPEPDAGLLACASMDDAGNGDGEESGEPSSRNVHPDWWAFSGRCTVVGASGYQRRERLAHDRRCGSRWTVEVVLRACRQPHHERRERCLPKTNVEGWAECYVDGAMSRYAAPAG